MYTGELLEIQNNTGASITYNGKSYSNGSYVPLGKLIQYDVEYPKLWSSNTGRSLTGENKGTLIGVFPKIVVQIGNMTEANIKAILKLTAQASTNVKYFNALKGTSVTASFYFGDVPSKLQKKSTMRHAPCEFSIISNKRMV